MIAVIACVTPFIATTAVPVSSLVLTPAHACVHSVLLDHAATRVSPDVQTGKRAGKLYSVPDSKPVRIIVNNICRIEHLAVEICQELLSCFCKTRFYPRDVMLARYLLSLRVCPSVCLSVRLPSQVGVLPKRLNTDHANKAAR